MPRIPRSQLLGTTPYLHIICRGNNRAILFHEEEDYACFRSKLRRYCIPASLDIYHYILMTTHVHLEICAHDLSHISRAFQRVQLTYCQYYHRKYPSTGHLWHNRFRSAPIESEGHLLRCGRYAELNSTHAAMVSHPAEYPWSSYHYYASGTQDDVVTPNPFYDAMGETVQDRQLAYREFIEEGMKIDRKEERVIFEPLGIVREQNGGKRAWVPGWCDI